MSSDLKVVAVPATDLDRPRALVLVVEDHVETNQYICETLSKDYRTQSAFDGREGLEKATQLRPDLILIDLKMPKMCGVDLAKAVRTHPELSAIPIVVLSASLETELRVRLLRETVQDYIDKPFSPEELLARVGNHIALKQAREELIRRNAELQRLASDLAAANQELEAFNYSVSHDLCAPSRRIVAYANLLASEYKNVLADKGNELVDSIKSQANRMNQLILDLLDFSRQGRLPMRLAAVDMTVLARSVFNELAGGLDRLPSLELQSLPTARADESLVRQVLINLVSNAVKFTRYRTEVLIEIGGREEGSYNSYYVKDNGAGFDENRAGKLFGVFQRLHPKTEFEGTGVGLALAQRIVQRHGGHIWAKARVNEGAIFHFTLPAFTTRDLRSRGSLMTGQSLQNRPPLSTPLLLFQNREQTKSLPNCGSRIAME